MPREYKLISGDSHVLEPPHLWKEYMPRKFHDKAPKVVPDGEGGEAWQFSPDVAPAPIGIYASAGRKHEEVRWTGVTFAAANQGNFRGSERLKEMDQDGVDAEVLFGSARMMSHFFSDEDPEFHLAGVHAFNDWVAEEFIKTAPDRLIGCAVMPALGVEAAIREMDRCVNKLGFRAIHMVTFPSVGLKISPADDPFFDAAQTLGVPIEMHVRVMRKIAKPRPKGVRGDDLTGLANVGVVDMMTDMPEIIASGVHDRFPRLTWVMVEAGSGWIPYILEQM
ncbi:MAG: amidohydrolase family protein, partial [Candidatus Binatia bacterium]